MKTRMLSMLLAVLMLVSVLCACQASTDTTTQPSTTTQDTTEPSAPADESEPPAADESDVPAADESETPAAEDAPTEAPVVDDNSLYNNGIVTLPFDETLEFSFWVGAPMFVNDMNDIPVMKKLSEEANIAVEFIHPASNAAAEQFSLILAAQEYYDVMSAASSMFSLSQLCEDEVSIDLTDRIDTEMPNYAGYLNANPAIRRDIVDDDGRVLGIYSINEAVTLTWGGYTIRKDLLEQFGMDAPQTYDDWEQFGVTCLDNGITIPIAMSKTGSYMYSTFEAGFGIGSRFYQDGDQVKYGPVEEGYREYVTLMHKWYDMGLFGPDFLGANVFVPNFGLADDAENYAGNVGATFNVSSSLGTLNYEVGLTDIPMHYMGIDLPGKTADTMPNWSRVGGSGCVGSGVFISTACAEEKIPSILALFDFMFTEPGYLMGCWGIENDTYTVDANGDLHYTDVIDTSNPDHINTFHLYEVTLYNFPGLKNDTERALARSEEIMGYQEIWTTSGTNFGELPVLSLTAEESEEYARVIGDVNTYVEEMTVKFIMGIEPLDKYDDFVAQLINFGVEDAIAAQQAAFDRYLNR